MYVCVTEKLHPILKFESFISIYFLLYKKLYF